MAGSAERRAARAFWEVAVVRDGDAVEADDLYWLRVPAEDRARLTWELSRELYSLGAQNHGVFDEERGILVSVEQGDLERRLPRAAFVVLRR